MYLLSTQGAHEKANLAPEIASASVAEQAGKVRFDYKSDCCYIVAVVK